MPAGCLRAIFGDIELDVIILEFAINEFDAEQLRRLVDELYHRFTHSIQIIILSVTSRLMKIANPIALQTGLTMNKQVTKHYSLIHIDWSILADKGFNTTYKPYEIWDDADWQHPIKVGRDWIQYTVGVTLKAIYDRYPSITRMTPVVSPMQNSPAVRYDGFCLTTYFCNVQGYHVDNFEQHAHIGKCWKKVDKDKSKKCAKFVYEDDFNPSCSTDDSNDHTIGFTANINRPCMLYAAIVGNGVRERPSLCMVDVYINQSYVYTSSKHNKYLAQHLLLLLPTPLEKGAYNVSVVGRQVEVGQTCNIATILCV